VSKRIKESKYEDTPYKTKTTMAGENIRMKEKYAANYHKK
jgi:hypothetical protein